MTTPYIGQPVFFYTRYDSPIRFGHVVSLGLEGTANIVAHEPTSHLQAFYENIPEATIEDHPAHIPGENTSDWFYTPAVVPAP